MYYQLVFTIHIYVSVVSLLSAILLIYRSLRGVFRKQNYTWADRFLSTVFVSSLYLQSLLGLLLYFSLDSKNNATLEAAQAMYNIHLRFWAIEHFSLMLFALFLSQLGKFFAAKTVSNLQKFRINLFYQGSALLLIFISISIALFSKM